MSVRITEFRELPHKVIKVLVVIVMLLIALPSSLSAQPEPAPEPAPKPLRFDLTPFIGYRTSMSFPVEPHVMGMNPRVILDASPSYGASFGLRLTNQADLIEIRWTRQPSYVHAEDITTISSRQHVILDQFHGDFSHEPDIEDWPPWARPFVIASVGATHVSGSDNFTRFSFGIGGGVRFYASRHLGFKIQAEWVPVFADPHVAFVCGVGCIVHAGGTASSQGEVFVAPILRF